MTVSELINKIGFEVDESTIGNVNKSIESLKKNAESIAGVITESIGSAVKEINDMIDDMLISATTGVDDLANAIQKLKDNLGDVPNSNTGNVPDNEGAENKGSPSEIIQENADKILEKLDRIYDGIVDGANSIVSAITGTNNSNSNGSDVKPPSNNMTSNEGYGGTSATAEEGIQTIAHCLNSIYTAMNSGFNSVIQLLGGEGNGKPAPNRSGGGNGGNGSEDLSGKEQEAEGEIDKVKSYSKNAVEGIGEIGGAMIDGLISGAKLLLSTLGIALSLNNLVKIADEYTYINRELKQITENSEEYKKAQDDILAGANELGIAYKDYEQSVVKMAQANTRDDIDINKAQELLNLTDKLGKVYGMTNSEINTMNNQLVNATVTGSNLGGMIESWQTSAPGIIDAIIKGDKALKYGVKDSRELAFMAQQGLLTLNDVYESLKLSGDEIESKYARLSVTIEEAQTSIQNSFKFFISRINDSIDANGQAGKAMLNAFRPLESIMNKIADACTTIKEKLGSASRAFKVVATLGGSVAAMFGGSKLLSSLGKFSKVFEGLGKLIPGLSGKMSVLTKVFSKIGAVGGVKLALIIAAIIAIIALVEDLVMFMKGKDSMIGRLLSAEDAQKLKDTLNNVMALSKQLLSTIMKLLKPIIGLVAKLFAVLVPIFALVVQIVSKVLEALLPPIIRLVESLIPVIEVICELLDPILQLVVDLIDPLMELVDIVMDLLQPIIDLLGPIIDFCMLIIMGILMPVVSFLKVIIKILSPILGFIIKIVNFVLKLFKPIMDSIGEFLGFIMEKLNIIFTFFSAFFGEAGSLFEDVGDTIFGELTEALDGVVEWFDGIVEKWESIWGQFVDFLKSGKIIELFSNAIEWIKKNWLYIVSFIKNPIATLFAYFYKHSEKFRNFVDGIVSWVKGIVRKIFEFFGLEDVFDSLDDASGKVIKFFSDIFDYIQDFPENAKEWGKDLIDNMVSGITGGIDKIKEAATNIAEGIKGILGFSEPEEGPLSNFHTYMPDMIDLMTTGIEDGKEKVKGVVSNLAEMISGNINIGDVISTFNPLAGAAYNFVTGSSSGGKGGVVQNVTINNSFNCGNNSVSDIQNAADSSFNVITENLSYALNYMT